MFNRTNLILVECDECGEVWEQEESEGLECMFCEGMGHKYVSRFTVNRMRGILGRREVEVERLLGAFMACTVGGEGFARAVLARAVEWGVIVQEDGRVREIGD